MTVRHLPRRLSPTRPRYQVDPDDHREVGVGGHTYELTDLPAGEYSAIAGPDQYGAGYESRSYGAGETTGAVIVPRTIKLAAGGARPGIDFALARTYAIEGRVTNEYGEPLAQKRQSAVERLVNTPSASRSPRTTA